ncbi:MAG: hypothetical protein NZU63_10715 [Gemmataceae bacterium]|nr:hypothetical protein [Gemmataceae bacterium]MDW8243004.1 hypothetical protein [Thermogemmata sp.]
MKRFIGLLLTVAGLGGALWGGVHVLTGGATTRLSLTSDFSLPAMTIGLIGLTLLTVGFIWLRE